MTSIYVTPILRGTPLELLHQTSRALTMPLILSGYLLSYSDLNPLLSTIQVNSSATPIPRSEKVPISESARSPHSASCFTSATTDPAACGTNGGLDSDDLAHWGPIIWLNRWLEKEGMGAEIQAVPLYDPTADECAGEQGQTLLLVRHSVFEGLKEPQHMAPGSHTRTAAAAAATNEDTGKLTPVPLRSATASSARSPILTPGISTHADKRLGDYIGSALQGVAASEATTGHQTPCRSSSPSAKSVTKDSRVGKVPSELLTEKERGIQEWIISKLLCGTKDVEDLKWVSVVNPYFEEV